MEETERSLHDAIMIVRRAIKVSPGTAGPGHCAWHSHSCWHLLTASPCLRALRSEQQPMGSLRASSLATSAWLWQRFQLLSRHAWGLPALVHSCTLYSSPLHAERSNLLAGRLGSSGD